MMMARTHRTERYGRETEPGAWWAAKRYGYGADLPIAWQGGVVMLAYVALLETGQRKNPSLIVLKRIAKALGVPVTTLLAG